MTKERKPSRNWREYNEHLVRRGEILFDVESLKGWQEELKEMNLGKNGRPFKYPHSFILFLGILRVVFGLPYRQIEGFARGLGKIISIPAPDYSTLSLRILKLELPSDLGYELREGEEVVIACGCHRDKGSKPRGVDEEEEEGLLKRHVAVDTKSKQVVSLEVTSEGASDGEKLLPLVKKAQRKVKVKRVLGDGGYDSHENFEFLAACGVEAGIKVREDSDPNCGGERGEVLRANPREPPGWKEGVGYGGWLRRSFPDLSGSLVRWYWRRGLSGW